MLWVILAAWGLTDLEDRPSKCRRG